jgi:hypothetical protein
MKIKKKDNWLRRQMEEAFAIKWLNEQKIVPRSDYDAEMGSYWEVYQGELAKLLVAWSHVDDVAGADTQETRR